MFIKPIVCLIGKCLLFMEVYSKIECLHTQQKSEQGKDLGTIIAKQFVEGNYILLKKSALMWKDTVTRYILYL